MKFRKRLTIAIVTLVIVLFVVGSVADLIVTTTETSNQEYAFSNLSYFEPSSETAKLISVSTTPSMIGVTLDANGTLLMTIERNGEMLYSKNESKLLNNFQISETGDLNVTLRNNNSDIVYATYTFALTSYLTKTEKPFAWLFVPTFIVGDLSLCCILPITFYDDMKRKWNKKIGEPIVFALAVALILGFMPLIGVATGTNSPLVSPTSSSMQPTISPGDLALVTGADPKTLSVGDIIVYDVMVNNLSSPAPNAVGYKTMHRIVAIKTEWNEKFFLTKGDNNANPDDWYVPQEGVRGKVVFVIPYLGYAVMALARIDVKIEAIAAMMIIIAAWSLKKPKGVKNEKKPASL